MFTIYKYTCANKRNYVGITMYPEVRRGQHRQKEFYYADTTKFAKAIQEFGYDNLAYEVIETVETLEQACEREVYWISFYDSVASGYNMMPGGMNAPVFVHGKRVIEDIKYLLKETELTLYEIADKTGVCVSYVSQIKNGKLRSVEPIIRTHKSRKGEKNGKSKLTNSQVIEIQKSIKAGVSRKELRLKFNVSKTLIQLVATEAIWKHVDSEYEYEKKVTNGNAVLDREKVSKLKQDIKTGTFTRVQLAEKYGISVPTVDQIKAGKTWKDVE